MAHVAEDLSAGLALDLQRFPAPGEKWIHCKTGRTEEILFFEFSRKSYSEGDDFLSYPVSVLPLRFRQNLFIVNYIALACCEIEENKQCVVYASDKGLYVRTIENFLERFEDGEYRFERI